MEALNSLDRRESELFIVNLLNNIVALKDRRELMRRCDHIGRNAGYFAVKYENAELLKFFIKAGMDIRNRDDKGRTL